MTLDEFQRQIEAIYGAKDARRGPERSYLWFVEEVGELAEAIRLGQPDALRHELGDVLAWLFTLASMLGVDMADAAARYAGGCPRCGATPCVCAEP